LESVVIAAAWISPDLGRHGSELRRGRAAIEAVIDWMRARAPEQGETLGAASYDVLNLFGVVLLGVLWLRMAATAQDQLAKGEGDPVFLQRKLVLARYWFEREMPAIETFARRARSGADGLMALAADAF
ncbi:MAG TPA: acyl-CoA dehydrogenase C-terminal domain-containing protein, partial [Phenylobacterium sp.]